MGTGDEMKAIRDVFSRFLGRRQGDGVLKDSDLHTSAGRVDFLLVIVNDKDLEKVGARVGQVVDIAAQYGADVLGMDASLVFIAFGAGPVKTESGANDRQRLAVALQAAVPGELAILHGSSNARFGTIGSSSRMSWTALLPDFKGLLRDLSALQYGEVRDVGST
jgi:hypothetical protein